MQILCENAGAQSGALIMTRGGELYLEVAVKIADGICYLAPTPYRHKAVFPRPLCSMCPAPVKRRCWPMPAQQGSLPVT